MPPNTLFNFYKKRGESLPSIEKRRKMFERRGLGSASDFRGSAGQNTKLLESLRDRPNPVSDAKKGAADAADTEPTIQEQREGLIKEAAKPERNLIDRIVEERMQARPATDILQEERESRGVGEFDQEIQKTQDVIDNISENLLRTKTFEEGRPIAAGLIRGRTAQAEKQAVRRLQPLETRLGRLTERRGQAADTASEFAELRAEDQFRVADALREQLELEGEFLSPLRRKALERALEDLEPEMPEIRSVGKNLVAVKPDGTTEVIYSAPSTGGGGGGQDIIDITPEDRRILVGSGLSTDEINSIEQDVSSFGVEEVLNGIDDPAQKEAIRKVYNVAESAPSTPEEFKERFRSALTQMKTTHTRDEAEAAIKAQYGDDLDTMPASIKNAMEDALVEVYGRTFWQKLIPGGR